ncbi:MAG: HD domain-containing protein [Theionarchaea archaeon]|nr:HD domain-containing protein [Theionarchaea archaeon]
MELTQSMQTLTEYCKSGYKRTESVIHQWGHILRTAQGAVFFVHVLGGTEREEQLAYTAGILHDIVRPANEEMCHAQASAEKALNIIKRYPEFANYEKLELYQAIRNHRYPVEWKSLIHQSVYLSDKICEHMGAYLDFRAPAWAGELSHSKFKGLEPIESVLKYYDIVSKKFLAENYPDSLKCLVDYQVDWNKRFVEALETYEGWAVEMAEQFFLSGKRREDFDSMLITFNPKGTQKEWVTEMRDYIGGKKFKHFQSLLMQ